MNMEIKIFLITVTVILFGSCIIAGTDVIPEEIEIEQPKLDTNDEEIRQLGKLFERCGRRAAKKEKIQKLFERFKQFEQQMEIRNGAGTDVIPEEIEIEQPILDTNEKDILQLGKSFVSCIRSGRRAAMREKIQKLFERFEQFVRQMEIRNGADTDVKPEKIENKQDTNKEKIFDQFVDVQKIFDEREEYERKIDELRAGTGVILKTTVIKQPVFEPFNSDMYRGKIRLRRGLEIPKGEIPEVIPEKIKIEPEIEQPILDTNEEELFGQLDKFGTPDEEEIFDGHLEKFGEMLVDINEEETKKTDELIGQMEHTQKMSRKEKIQKLFECFERFVRQMEIRNGDSSNSSNTQQNDNLSQQNYSISDDEVKKLSESLFDMDKNNAYKYITVNLQNETKEHCTVDNAPLPLLDIKPEAYEISTIKNLRALYENSTMDENKIEDLLNRYLETDVFKMTMKFLVEKNLISSNKYKFKDTLRRIWFSNQYLKIFERFDMKYKNWIYFAKEEEQKKIDYRGYIKNIKLADKGEAIKLCFNIRDIRYSVTILLGLSPELEMALYTACYHLRPRNNCMISLGGKDINLVPHKIFYYIYGKRI